MAGRVGPGLRRTGWGQGTGNQSSWPRPMLSRLPSSKGATSVPGVTEPQDSLLGAWKQAQRDSEACCPGAATMATRPGLCPLLAPLDGWSTRDPSTCPRHHLPSLPPRSLLSRTKLAGPLGKRRRNKPSRSPAALLCSLPQTPSSLGFEEGQAGILIPAPPLLTGAACLTSLESHTAHLWKKEAMVSALPEEILLHCLPRGVWSRSRCLINVPFSFPPPHSLLERAGAEVQQGPRSLGATAAPGAQAATALSPRDTHDGHVLCPQGPSPH